MKTFCAVLVSAVLASGCTKMITTPVKAAGKVAVASIDVAGDVAAAGVKAGGKVAGSAGADPEVIKAAAILAK